MHDLYLFWPPAVIGVGLSVQRAGRRRGAHGCNCRVIFCCGNIPDGRTPRLRPLIHTNTLPAPTAAASSPAKRYVGSLQAHEALHIITI